jgi:hypothetical protein
MAYTLPPPLPSQDTRPDTFDADVEAMFAWWPIALAETDAARNQAVASAEAGASGHRFTFDPATAAADPTSGKIRFNNANLGAATALYISATTATSTAIGALLDTFDDSTGTNKGLLRFVKSSDPSKFAMFTLTAIATPNSAYRTFTMVPIAASTSAPFGLNDAVSLQYAQYGNQGPQGLKGDPGTLLAPTLTVRDERASGTGGGDLTPTGAWKTRVLNTTKLNTISGASLASNQVILPAGTYEYEGSAPAWLARRHQCRLYSVTDSSVVNHGTSECTTDSGTIYPSSRSFVSGRLTVPVSTTKTFELQHYSAEGGHFQAAGQPVSSGGVEVYTEITFRKVD